MPERYTLVTELLRREIQAAATRHCGWRGLSKATGISERTFWGILNDREYITESLLDKFCCSADTEIWITDFEWITFDEKVIPDHGIQRYRLGCRCFTCEKAARRRNTLKIKKHGTLAKFREGCKCDRCLQAHTDWKRKLSLAGKKSQLDRTG